MCERPLFQLDKGSIECRGQLDEMGMRCEMLHQQIHTNNLAEQVLSDSLSVDAACAKSRALAGSCEGRRGHLESCTREHRDRFDGLRSYQERHRQAKHVSLQVFPSAATLDQTANTSETLTETTSLHSAATLDETVNASETLTETTSLHSAATLDETVNASETLTETTSLPSAATFVQIANASETLTETTSRPSAATFDQIANASETLTETPSLPSAHKLDQTANASETLTGTTGLRLTELENFSQKCKGVLREFFVHLQEQQQRTQALSERVLSMDTRGANANAMLGMMLTGSCGQHLPQIERGIQEHQAKPTDPGKCLEQSQQQEQAVSEASHSTAAAEENMRIRIEAMMQMCERRLSELETGNKVHRDKLNEVGMWHDKHGERVSKLTALCESRFSQVEKTVQDSLGKLEELRTLHELQKERVSALSEQRLSQLENGNQEHGHKLRQFDILHEEHHQHANTLSERVFSVEAAYGKVNAMLGMMLFGSSGQSLPLPAHDIRLREAKHAEPGVHDKQYQPQEKSVSEETHSAVAANESISLTLEAVTKMCEMRLSQLESGSQEQRDKLKEVSLYNEKQAQRLELFSAMYERRIPQLEDGIQENKAKIGLLSEQAGKQEEQANVLPGEKLDPASEILTNMCKQRLSKLENSAQEHSDRLEQFGTHQQENLQQAQLLSEHIVAIEATCTKAFNAIEAVAGSCQGHLSQLEDRFLEHGGRLEQLSLNHEKQQQQTNALSVQMVSLADAHDQKHQQHVRTVSEHMLSTAQHTKSLSEQMNSMYTAHSSKIETLEAMLEQGLSHSENGSQKHNETLNICPQSICELEFASQKQKDALDEVETESSLAEGTLLPDEQEKAKHPLGEELFAALGSIRHEVETVKQLVTSSQALLENTHKSPQKEPSRSHGSPLLQINLCGERGCSGTPEDDASFFELTPRSEPEITSGGHTACPHDWDAHFGVSEDQLQTLRNRYSSSRSSRESLDCNEVEETDDESLCCLGHPGSPKRSQLHGG